MLATAANAHFAATPELPFAEGRLWCELIEDRCGIHFPESQWHALRRALWQGMQRSSASSYGQYYRILTAGADSAEWKHLLEDVLNPETTFFRHQPSFAALEKAVLASWRGNGAAAGLDPCRIWSAGCSTGEEAYSLAMVALAVTGRADVTGSDLNHSALARARNGRYSTRQMAGVRSTWLSRFFGPASAAGHREVTPELHAAVSFAPFHLLDRSTYPAREFDVIFCCNVLVYFRQPARQQALAGLISRLRPGGYLFLAPGEAAGVSTAGAVPARLDGTYVLRRAG